MKKRIYSLMILLFTACFSMSAQQAKTYTVQGTVYDEKGEVFPGVTVYIKDKVNLGTSTGVDGKFSIKVSSGDRLVFSFMGYQKQEYLVTEEKTNLEIHLAEDANKLDEVVIVAHGAQRKISSLASVSTIEAKDLQAPAPSIANMLGGRIAGVISLQTSGEPGKNLAEFWVRGISTFGANSSALVLIDGLEGDINAIDPADIESFSVLKDASATAVYGVRGANGVVLITTKRGEEGKLSITGRANFSVAHISRIPKYLRAYEYAKLANEAYEVRGEQARYNDIQLDVIKDGLDPDLYPDVDWQNEILNRNSLRQSYYASAKGGGQIARYFLSLGLSNESAAYKAESDNPYASNAGYSKYSFRSNLDINLTKSTVLYFGTEGFQSYNIRPGQINTDYIWQAQAMVTPLLYPTIYSNGQLPAAGGDDNLMSPYVLINRMGKSNIQSSSQMFTLSLSQDLNSVLKGLRFKIQGAYNRNGELTERRFVIPAMYRALGRNNLGNLVTRQQVAATDLIYSKGESQYRKYYLQSQLNYEAVLGDKHRISGLAYHEISDEQNTNDTYSSLAAIPHRYQRFSGRLAYGFDDLYLIDLNFGFSGSENFPPGKQYGFFPSLAMGWVPTQYEWVKSNMPWLSFFKIRGSIGTVGNDQIGGSRFPYLTRVLLANTVPWGGSSVEVVHISREGADNLVWENAIKSNIAADMELFNKNLSLTVDFFNDQRNGIFQQRVQVPDYVGLITLPYGNVGRMKSWGSDGQISFRKTLNENMDFTLRANFTYSQNLVQNWERLNEQYPYKEWHGQPYQGVRGLQCIGFFKDEDDIKYSPKQAWGEVMPGDLKYKDINGDGKINDDDVVPLTFKPMYPILMYGAGGEYRYKRVTLGVRFKGVGQVDYFRNGMGYIPFQGGETGNVLEQFKDPATRWIPKDYALTHGIDPALAENPNAILPRLQYGNNNNNSRTSDFWKGDASYVRLEEVMLSYNMASKKLRMLGVSSVNFQFVCNNLYVWDKVKIFDPEQADKRGQVYPIPTTYSIQMYINL